MVKLSLVSAKGNAGGRTFPCSGYLGLTPLRFDGFIRTTLERDAKPILAKSVSVHVRCYESRVGKTGSHHPRILLDYSKVLWQKPHSEDYAPLGDFDSPFRITLPPSVPGFSTANYQEYRVFWRIEAIIEHINIPVVGCRIIRHYEIPLTRYDIPPLSYPPPPSSPSSSTPHILHLPNSKPPVPLVSYNLSTPIIPVGPSDLIFTSVFLRPLDRTLAIRSATVLVERRIDLHPIPSADSLPVALDDPGLTSLLPSKPFFSVSSPTPPPVSLSASMPEPSSHAGSPYSCTPLQSSTSFAESSYSVTSMTPLLHLPPPLPPLPTSPASPSAAIDPPCRSVSATIIHGDNGGLGGFAYDTSTGVWSKTVSLTWPKTKSQHVWAMGETSRSELADISFWVKVKIVVSSPSCGTFTLDLEPRELTIVSTNDSERRLALAKYAEQKEACERNKSKSKSPGRRRIRDNDGEAEGEREGGGSSNSEPHNSRSTPPSIPPLPPMSMRPPTSSNAPSAFPHTSMGANHSSASKASRSSSRRPHTSAGPRDTPNAMFGASSTNVGRSSAIAKNVMTAPTSIAHSASDSRPPTADDARNMYRRHVFAYDHEKDKEALIKSWEEELAAVNNTPRRSGVGMLGFFGGASKKLRGRLGVGTSNLTAAREGSIGVGAG